jgi:hypothetical protein
MATGKNGILVVVLFYCYLQSLGWHTLLIDVQDLYNTPEKILIAEEQFRCYSGLSFGHEKLLSSLPYGYCCVNENDVGYNYLSRNK